MSKIKSVDAAAMGLAGSTHPYDPWETVLATADAQWDKRAFSWLTTHAVCQHWSAQFAAQPLRDRPADWLAVALDKHALRPSRG